SVVERYAYDPYGTVTILSASFTVLSSSAYAWVYLNQGSRFDFVTGLYHHGGYGGRDLDPNLMRRIEEDPLRTGVAPWYGDKGNSPVNGRHPSGSVDIPEPGGTFWLDTFPNPVNRNFGPKIKGPSKALKNVDLTKWSCDDLVMWIAFASTSINSRVREYVDLINRGRPLDDTHAPRIIAEIEFLNRLIAEHKSRCKEKIDQKVLDRVLRENNVAAKEISLEIDPDVRERLGVEGF